MSQARPGLQKEARSLGTRGACYKTSDWARFVDGGCRHTGSKEKEAHIVNSPQQFPQISLKLVARIIADGVGWGEGKKEGLTF